MKKKSNDELDKFINNATITAKDIMNTKDDTKDFNKNDIKNNKGMAILAYLFVPIPLLLEKKSEYVKYHSKQGFNLFIFFILYAIIYGFLSKLTAYEKMCTINGFDIPCGKYVVPWFVELPFLIVGILIVSLLLVGIVNVINGKAKRLPIIGNIKILK